MSNSRRREEIADGVGESAERVRRMLPLWLMKSSRRLGDSAGPSPTLNQYPCCCILRFMAYLSTLEEGG